MLFESSNNKTSDRKDFADSAELQGRKKEVGASAFLSGAWIKPIPANSSGIRNGTLVRIDQDFPEVGIRKGEVRPAGGF